MKNFEKRCMENFVLADYDKHQIVLDIDEELPMDLNINVIFYFFKIKLMKNLKLYKYNFTEKTKS